MCSENPLWNRPGPTEPVPLDPAGDESFVDLAEWVDLRPPPLWDNLWDAFELDDEMAEPQPEHGDFWAEPHDQQEI